MPIFSRFQRMFGKNITGGRLCVVLADEDTKTNQTRAVIIDAEIESQSTRADALMSRISDIEGKEFKLWCPVHSSGQGYITCHYEIEKDHFELFSSGTDEDAQALQLRHDPNKEKEGEETNYWIYLMHENNKYYLCCNDDGSVVACKDDNKKALFIINTIQQGLHHSVLRIRGHENKMLKIGGEDRLTSKNTNEKVDSGRFMDPASSFAIVVA